GGGGGGLRAACGMGEGHPEAGGVFVLPGGEVVFPKKVDERAAASGAGSAARRQPGQKICRAHVGGAEVAGANLDCRARSCRYRRAPADDTRDRGHGRTFSRRDAGGEEHWVLKSGAVDAELFPKAGCARSTHGRRRARSEEPAERDDDSPRAAEAEACASTGNRRGGAGRSCRRPGVSTRPHKTCGHHWEGDSSTRRSPEWVPEICASRRAEAP